MRSGILFTTPQSIDFIYATDFDHSPFNSLSHSDDAAGYYDTGSHFERISPQAPHGHRSSLPSALPPLKVSPPHDNLRSKSGVYFSDHDYSPVAKEFDDDLEESDSDESDDFLNPFTSDSSCWISCL